MVEVVFTGGFTNRFQLIRFKPIGRETEEWLADNVHPGFPTNPI